MVAFKLYNMSSSSDSNSLAGDTDPSTDTSPVELRTDKIVDSTGNDLLKRVVSLLGMPITQHEVSGANTTKSEYPYTFANSRAA